MNNLVAGVKLQSKKDHSILEIVGLDKEQGKAIMDNGKMYSFSTIYRWFDLVEQPVAVKETPEQPKEVVENRPVEEKVVGTPVQPIKPTIPEEKPVEDKQPKEHTEQANNHVVEGKNSRDELNNILITHNCYLKKMKQYEAVRSDRTTGTLIYIRFAKEGGYHFDVSQKTWSKLTKDYASWLIENFGACIKDKTRKLYRISCNNLEIFQVLLLTALS